MENNKRCSPYPKVGEKAEITDQPGVYCLIIEDWIKKFDPNYYFVTSGEAVEKAKAMEKAAWKLAGDAKKLVNALKLARASAKYLEATWESGNLILKQKNPRNKSRHTQSKIASTEH